MAASSINLHLPAYLTKAFHSKASLADGQGSERSRVQLSLPVRKANRRLPPGATQAFEVTPSNAQLGWGLSQSAKCAFGTPEPGQHSTPNATSVRTAETHTEESGSSLMHGEAPKDWNWDNWTYHWGGEEFVGNWGDWRFFDLEGKVTKQFCGKRLGRCNAERTVWYQRNFHNIELSPGRAFNEEEQMWEMNWQLEKDTCHLSDGLMHTFMPDARVATFGHDTRCLVQRDLRGKAKSYGWESSFTDGEYHTSVTPTWRKGAFSSCGVISEKHESWPEIAFDATCQPLEAALGQLSLQSAREVTWTRPGGTGTMCVDDVSNPRTWPTTAPGYHEIAIPLGAWAVGPSTLPEAGATDGFWLSTAKRMQDGSIKRLVHMFSKDLLVEKALLEIYAAP